MINKYEFLTFRVDNSLAEIKPRPYSVSIAGLGKVAVYEASLGEVTIGKFASSRRQLKRSNIIAHFIESAFEPEKPARQLWLPYEPDPSKRKRVIIATSSSPDQRLVAWQTVAHLADDLKDYSPYDEEGNALYEEARLLLHFADANNENFDFRVTSIDTVDKYLGLVSDLQSLGEGPNHG